MSDFLPGSTNSSAWTDYETALFDVLEALKPHFPQIAGGFARMTGGVDSKYIVSELRAAPATAAKTKALADVAAERARQVEKLGWTHEHDKGHDNDRALSRAAACYALANPRSGDSGPFWITHLRTPSQVWPYRWEWKPKDRRTNLVRAAALLIAEIERFDRAALTAGTKADQ